MELLKKYWWVILIILVLVFAILYYRKYLCEKAQEKQQTGTIKPCNFWTGKPKKCSTCGQKIKFNL